MPPGCRDECRPDVDFWIAEPVHRPGCAGGTEKEVEQAVVLGVEQLPDHSDQHERQHHRAEEDALVDAGSPDVLVEQDCQEQTEGCCDHRQEDQPEHVVLESRPERRIVLEDIGVVRQASRTNVRKGEPVPAYERQEHRDHGRDPNQYELDQGRHEDHGPEDDLVATGQQAIAAAAGPARREDSPGRRLCAEGHVGHDNFCYWAA